MRDDFSLFGQEIKLEFVFNKFIEQWVNVAKITEFAFRRSSTIWEFLFELVKVPALRRRRAKWHSFRPPDHLSHSGKRMQRLIVSHMKDRALKDEFKTMLDENLTAENKLAFALVFFNKL
jgi:hypothetical protein